MLEFIYMETSTNRPTYGNPHHDPNTARVTVDGWINDRRVGQVLAGYVDRHNDQWVGTPSCGGRPTDAFPAMRDAIDHILRPYGLKTD